MYNQWRASKEEKEKIQKAGTSPASVEKAISHMRQPTLMLRINMKEIKHISMELKNQRDNNSKEADPNKKSKVNIPPKLQN